MFWSLKIKHRLVFFRQVYGTLWFRLKIYSNYWKVCYWKQTTDKIKLKYPAIDLFWRVSTTIVIEEVIGSSRPFCVFIPSRFLSNKISVESILSGGLALYRRPAHVVFGRDCWIKINWTFIFLFGFILFQSMPNSGTALIHCCRISWFGLFKSVGINSAIVFVHTKPLSFGIERSVWIAHDSSRVFNCLYL